MSVEAILRAFASGTLSLEAACERLRQPAYEDLGYAKLDLQREWRRGFGEVVYCPGKTNEQLLGILKAFHEKSRAVLASRCSPEQHAFLEAAGLTDLTYDPCSRLLVQRTEAPAAPIGRIAVCTGGTADLPVAEEAAQTAAFFGAAVDRHYDIGVAGIHRLFAKLEAIRRANVIVVAAGMEGALGGVLAGLVDVPVFAVPTSVGYGASFNGLAPLLTMLNACAEGMAVVNIDNGYGAGYLAAQINRLVEKTR